jgi:TRAP-type mannitol/chloroaromatic compound transport system permease small subunit
MHCIGYTESESNFLKICLIFVDSKRKRKTEIQFYSYLFILFYFVLIGYCYKN